MAVTVAMAGLLLSLSGPRGDDDADSPASGHRADSGTDGAAGRFRGPGQGARRRGTPVHPHPDAQPVVAHRGRRLRAGARLRGARLARLRSGSGSDPVAVPRPARAIGLRAPRGLNYRPPVTTLTRKASLPPLIRPCAAAWVGK